VSQELLTVSWMSCIRLEPAQSVRLECSEGRWTISRDNEEFSFHLPDGATSDALAAIRRDGAPLDTLVADEQGLPRDARSVRQIGHLWRQGFFVKAIYDGDEKVAEVRNFGSAPMLSSAVDPADALILPETSCVRRCDGHVLIESSGSGAYLLEFGDRLQRMPVPMFRPATCAEWASETGLPEEVVAAIASSLVSIGALKRSGPRAAAETLPYGWSFADHMVHARSSFGRHIAEYGTMRKYQGRHDKLAPREGRPGDRIVELPRPDLKAIAAQDRPFTEVLENRRSLRDQDDRPLTLAALGEFLYRSARVTGKVGTGPLEITLRPYPSGGGLHELEIYPFVNRCDGLDAGVYRYEPYDHRLIHCAPPGPGTSRLVASTHSATRMQGEPQVLFLIAARFNTVNVKYGSIAYSLILKNLGGLFQTMNLVATAMGLAGCILGCRYGDVFCDLVGTDYWQESTVGEFLLGTCRTAESPTLPQP